MTTAIPFGYLLVNKPSGPTSYDMIRWVKRIVPDAKIGHCGTLDPIAEGLLILLFGRATKYQAQFMGADKTYYFHVRLGLKTDTGDTTGAAVETRNLEAPVSDDGIKKVLPLFLGLQNQTPPMYSALKKEGVPLYKLARQGKTVERQPRPITIHEINFVDRASTTDFGVRIRCSSGTYVRVLAEDIGIKLNLPSTMSSLRREAIGKFDLSQAVHGDVLREMSVEALLSHIARVSVDAA